MKEKTSILINKASISEVIKFLRFPLAVMVVFIHANNKDVVLQGVVYDLKSGLCPIYESLTYIISETISRCAVPCFFLISGFLFFRGVDFFSADVFKQKLKRRVKSLLIPYLIWNAITLLLFYLSQQLLPGLNSGATKAIADYSFIDWIRSFWDLSNGFPICSQFWFIRDLMVMVIFTPLIYFLCKKTGWFYLATIGVLWLLSAFKDIPGLSLTGLFFFSSGALLSIKKVDVLEVCTRIMIPSLIIFSVITCIEVVYRSSLGGGGNSSNQLIQYIVYKPLYHINQLFIVSLFFSISAVLIDNGKAKCNQFLLDSNFFIFAYHVLPLALIFKILTIILKPQSDLPAIIMYFTGPVIVILVGLMLFAFLKKFFPRLTDVISGKA